MKTGRGRADAHVQRLPYSEVWQGRSSEQRGNRGAEQSGRVQCLCVYLCVCVFVGRVSWDHPSTTLFTKHSTPPPILLLPSSSFPSSPTLSPIVFVICPS